MSRAPRIDAHQHFWSLAKPWCAWPTAATPDIHRDFGPEDLRDLLRAGAIDATVLVQAAPDFAETLWMLDLAAGQDVIAGVVGWVDFTEPADAIDNLDEALDRGPLVGVRPMLQSIEDPAWILDPAFEPVFAALIARGVAFDALIRPVHLPAIATLADRYPDLAIVVDHAAKPEVRARRLDPWRADLAALARRSNVRCKLSGLPTEAEPGAGPDVFRPYVEHLLACFGPERLMWGSDWPVVRLGGDYATWLQACEALLAELPDSARAAVFGGVARATYGLRL
ncbi:amidohydrolase [uncultured Caulobacter sp.]|uniref:amidohydrolase family protein n=1 Tax=uncultured Caulobacter sp. TaxID=158749 RepID=UPI0026312893|nr:amidohydrolase family protein [uncultured Caulobacter sp.]